MAGSCYPPNDISSIRTVFITTASLFPRYPHLFGAALEAAHLELELQAIYEPSLHRSSRSDAPTTTTPNRPCYICRHWLLVGIGYWSRKGGIQKQGRQNRIKYFSLTNSYPNQVNSTAINSSIITIQTTSPLELTAIHDIQGIHK